MCEDKWTFIYLFIINEFYNRVLVLYFTLPYSFTYKQFYNRVLVLYFNFALQLHFKNTQKEPLYFHSFFKYFNSIWTIFLAPKNWLFSLTICCWYTHKFCSQIKGFLYFVYIPEVRKKAKYFSSVWNKIIQKFCK